VKKKILNNSFIYHLYKLLKIFRNKKPSFHYGEFAEDIFIDRIFRKVKKGIYVDVGCYHPFKGSLTFRLFNRGWNGINIDISKTSIDLFKISRNKDTNLNLAITDYDGDVFYYENSPINQQNSIIKSNDQQSKIKIKCNKLTTVLIENNIKNFDYLNIDVEGAELNVIRGLDFDKFSPNLISVENNNLLIKDYMESEVFKILTNNNYVFINKIGVTNFFIKKDLSDNFMDLIKV
jgi:FkbM family methyltransferase